MKQKNGYISVKYGPNVAKFELDLYLMMIHVYAKFHHNRSFQTKVIARKRKNSTPPTPPLWSLSVSCITCRRHKNVITERNDPYQDTIWRDFHIFCEKSHSPPKLKMGAYPNSVGRTTTTKSRQRRKLFVSESLVTGLLFLLRTRTMGPESIRQISWFFGNEGNCVDF